MITPQVRYPVDTSTVIPDRVTALVLHAADRMSEASPDYDAEFDRRVTAALTVLVAAHEMRYVRYGRFGWYGKSIGVEETSTLLLAVAVTLDMADRGELA